GRAGGEGGEEVPCAAPPAAALLTLGTDRLAGALPAGGGEQADAGHHQDAGDRADDPAADRAELGELRAQRLLEAVLAWRGRGAVGSDRGHDDAPALSASC